YRYLRGETTRPATTLVDSRPFVELNNLIYVSSAEITSFRADLVSPILNPKDAQTYLSVDGLPAALDGFLASGRWPGTTLGRSRRTPATPVTSADLARFMPALETLAATQPRSPHPDAHNDRTRPSLRPPHRRLVTCAPTPRPLA
ncbi:MAG TPA: hypothetical protein VIO38_07100, partial [Rariglobus sp.]